MQIDINNIMEEDQIHKDNFLTYAAKNYRDIQGASHEDFVEDVERFRSLKKLLKRYIAKGELKERLINNHIIVIHNVFGIQAGNKMLEHRIDKECYPILKSFLIYQNNLTKNSEIAKSLEIPAVQEIVNNL